MSANEAKRAPGADDPASSPNAKDAEKNTSDTETEAEFYDAVDHLEQKFDELQVQNEVEDDDQDDQDQDEEEEEEIDEGEDEEEDYDEDEEDQEEQDEDEEVEVEEEEEEEEEDDNEHNEENYKIEDCSDNSDVESKPSEIKVASSNLINESADDIKKETKFVPLHERLNSEMKQPVKAESDEQKIDTSAGVGTNDEEEKEPDDIDQDSLNDPHFVNEKQLGLEQVSLSPHEKEEKLKEALELKQAGNDLFKEEKYSEALEVYTQALRSCPIENTKDRSVFYSNRSICYLKMKEIEKCIKDCSRSIELDPKFIKPLLRRAECNETSDKLDQALKDYTELSQLEPRNMVYKRKCYELEETIKDRNEKLKNEMMGKLKDLGDMVLKPFGLSTSNFQFVQDPTSGSYSVNFKK